MFQTLLTLLIRAYQRVLRPVLPPACRFHPTCSDYALQSIRRFGPARGTVNAVRRLLRCHPWNPGGYDPVEAAARAPAPARAGRTQN